MAPQLAFLGMGSMGQAISKNLVQNGRLEKPIILWNRTSATATEHAAWLGHAEAVPTLEDAVARADLVWSCLSGQQAVLECFEKILAGDVRGKLFVECSTITSQATDKLAKQVLDKGGEFVAMPVFGEPSMANAAILTCLPTGAAESVQRVLPYLKGVIAKAVVDMSGEPPGTASHLKLICNVLIIQMIESIAEAHVLAEKTKLRPTLLDQVIQSVWPGPFAIYSARMMSGDYYKKEPVVNIDMAKNVASHVLAMAKESGTELAGYKVGAKHLNDVEAYAGRTGDIMGIYGAVRLENGFKYEN